MSRIWEDMKRKDSKIAGGKNLGICQYRMGGILGWGSQVEMFTAIYVCV